MKKWLLGLAAALGLTVAVLKAIPVTAPAAPAVEMGAQALEAHARGMLDACGPVICACDKRGECGIRGPVALLDGGTCVCE